MPVAKDIPQENMEVEPDTTFEYEIYQKNDLVAGKLFSKRKLLY